MHLLVMNSGSSSLKVTVSEDEEIIYKTQIDKRPTFIEEAEWEALFTEVREASGEFDVVLHRVVQGGWIFDGPRIVTPEVIAQIKELTELAPLHQPPSIATLERATALLPEVPQIVHFDSAYHATMPPEAYTYAVPQEWTKDLHVRRYGAHGLAHQYNAVRAAEILRKPLESLKIISAHLGSGASLCAIDAGQSVHTTMGLTPLEGLVMGTRSGLIDPEIIPWVVGHTDLSLDDVIKKLEFESGLTALGGTDHMGKIMDAYHAGDAKARLAVDVWLHRAAGLVAYEAAALGGVDALVFSGGIGENARDVRELLVAKLAFLGLKLDYDLNESNKGDSVISSAGSAVAIAVVNTREDISMIREAKVLLANS